MNKEAAGWAVIFGMRVVVCCLTGEHEEVLGGGGVNPKTGFVTLLAVLDICIDGDGHFDSRAGHGNGAVVVTALAKGECPLQALLGDGWSGRHTVTRDGGNQWDGKVRWIDDISITGSFGSPADLPCQSLQSLCKGFENQVHVFYLSIFAFVLSCSTLTSHCMTVYESWVESLPCEGPDRFHPHCCCP